MSNEVSRIWLALTALSGCAGLYGEVAVTKLSSTSVDPGGGAASTSGGAATQVGFVAGLELGSYSQRFGAAYSHDSFSSDTGDSTRSGADFLYEHNVYEPMDRLALRLGGGFGSGSGTYKDMTGASKTRNGFSVYGGVSATYFATWRTPIHVLVGVANVANGIAGGLSDGTGITFRAGISLMARDVRGSVDFVVPLENATDITGVIEAGAQAMGCTTVGKGRTDTLARLEVACGSRQIEYFQIAEGMLVTCDHEVSKKRCKALSEQITSAASGLLKAAQAPAGVPAASPTPPPAPSPAAPPTAPATPAADPNAPAAPPADPAAPATPAPTTP